jgi:hypothetical protein
VLVGLGTSLVVFGALLGLMAVVLPRPDDEREGLVESDRRRRNLDVTSVIGAVFVFAGTALLISAAWPWSLIALGVAALIYYGSLVIATWRDNRWLIKEIRIARDVDRRPDGSPGRVWMKTAVWLKIAPEESIDIPGVAFYGDPEDPNSYTYAEGAEKLAQEKARLSTALRRPMGGGQTPLDLLRARIIHRRMMREARKHARPVRTRVRTSGQEKSD